MSDPVKPSLHQPWRLVFVVVAILFGGGLLIVAVHPFRPAGVSVLPVNAPSGNAVRAEATMRGIAVQFAVSLDTQQAADAENWIVSTLPAHDPRRVQAVSIGTDDRTVFLEIPGIQPVMQMAIQYHLKSADGADVSGEIVNTIHALGE